MHIFSFLQVHVHVGLINLSDKPETDLPRIGHFWIIECRAFFFYFLPTHYMLIYQQ